MRWIVWIFGLFYLAALVLLAIAAFGLFGQDRDPLGGVFLLPLGLPWNLLADRLGIPGTAALVTAPTINLIILTAIWRWSARGRASVELAS